MIRMTRLTDYAIVLMTCCARHPERSLHTTKDLAAEARLPIPTVGKILKVLARRSLLESHRGVHGGYSLARAAESISIAEIIRAIEGPVSITDCSTHSGMCELETHCSVRSNWRKINRAVWSALEALTLADMTRPLPEDFVPLGSHVPRILPVKSI